MCMNGSNILFIILIFGLHQLESNEVCRLLKSFDLRTIYTTFFERKKKKHKHENSICFQCQLTGTNGAAYIEVYRIATAQFKKEYAKTFIQFRCSNSSSILFFCCPLLLPSTRCCIGGGGDGCLLLYIVQALVYDFRVYDDGGGGAGSACRMVFSSSSYSSSSVARC